MDRSVDLQLLRACCQRGIPPLPLAAIRRALELAGNDHTRNDALSEQIESDPRLRFSFVAVANLPMFCGSRPIKSVRQAVGDLGRRKTLSLFWLLALAGVLQSWKTPEARPRHRLWRHSLLTGVLAQQLVRAARFDEPRFDELGDALTAGLAHDIGHLLLANPEPRIAIAGHEEPGHEEYVRLAERNISLDPEHDHCRLGASLLEFWNAPQELVSCALRHHNPESSDIGHRPLVVGVRLADLLAEHLELDRATQALRLEAEPVWQQLATLEPWNQVAHLDRIAIDRLPDSLLTAQHLAQVLGR